MRDLLNGEGPVLGDGACATALYRRGLPIGTAPERWTLERPDAVADLAADYFGAGADFVTTNTFGGNRVRLEATGLADRIASVNIEAVRIAKEAAEPGRYVIGSVGPTGTALTGSEAVRVYAEQARLLADAGVDGFWCETICSVDEGRAVVEAVRSVCELPVIATFSARLECRAPVTLAGEPFGETLSAAVEAGADVVGVNCVDVDTARACVEGALGQTTPLAVSPNAGNPTRESDTLVYPDDDVRMASAVASMVVAGVRVAAGCCGTGPDYVAELRRRLDASERHRQE